MTRYAFNPLNPASHQMQLSVSGVIEYFDIISRATRKINKQPHFTANFTFQKHFDSWSIHHKFALLKCCTTEFGLYLCWPKHSGLRCRPDTSIVDAYHSAGAAPTYKPNTVRIDYATPSTTHV